MKQVFEEIAISENTVLECFVNTYKQFDGSKTFSNTYQFEVIYKESKIIVTHEIGSQNKGNFLLNVALGTKITDFKIVTKSHFWKLFHKNSTILQIECQNTLLKTKLEKLLIESNLEQIAKANLFVPNIFTKRNGYKNLEIIAEYNLEFPDKKGAIVSVMNFYKELIDYM